MLKKKKRQDYARRGKIVYNKECHLFDQNKEYRMIFREARQDRVEAVLTRQQEDAASD